MFPPGGVLQQQEVPSLPLLMGTPAYTTQAASTSITMNMPADIANGESLICFVGGDYASTASYSTVTPGWGNYGGLHNAAQDVGIWCFFKSAATGGDASIVVTSSASQRFHGWVMRISGVHPTWPVMNNWWDGAASGNPKTVASVNTYEANCLAFYAISSDTPASTSPHSPSGTGWSELVDAEYVGVGTSIGTKDVVTPGPTGDVLVTFPVTDSASFGQIALRPNALPAYGTINMLPQSRDLTTTPWANTGTVTFDQNGIGGTANTASKIVDTNPSGQMYYYCHTQLGYTNHAEPYTARFFLKKNHTTQNPPYPRLTLGFTVAANFIGMTGVYVQINTDTGAYNIDTNSGSGAGTCTVREYSGDTDWWEVLITDTNSAWKGYICLYLQPAYSASLGGGYSSSQIGEEIIGNVDLFRRTETADIAVGTPPVIVGN